MVEALKAVESTIKSICDARKWPYDQHVTVKPLIKVVLDNDLIPKSVQWQLTLLPALMEGVATPRNRMGGHGQGSQPVAVPRYLAAYALHLAAANIVLLVEAHRAKK